MQYKIKYSKEEAIETSKLFLEEVRLLEEKYSISFNSDYDIYLTFKNDKDIINFVRKNVGIDSVAIDKFVDKQLDAGFNLQQLAYVKALIIFISENGRFEKDDLLREELDFRKIFNNIEISKLIDDVMAVI